MQFFFLDNAPTRYLVNDACVLLGKPLVSGSALRWEGQLTVYNYNGGSPPMTVHEVKIEVAWLALRLSLWDALGFHLALANCHHHNESAWLTPHLPI